MRIHGLTGGIGSGKSTVAQMIRDEGVPVLDADVYAREAVAPGSEGLREVALAFGPGILAEDGSLARDRLGAIVFGDAAARRRLEGIIHPRVRQRMAEDISAHATAGAPIAFMDIPLLYESRDPDDFASVTVVYVPPEIQLARILSRDSLSEAAAQARLDAQLPIDEKARRASWIIDNTGSLEDTRAQVRLLIGRLRAEGGQ